MTALPSFLITRQQEREVARRDPLLHFRCASQGQEDVARYVAECVEVYAHAAERSGKSKIGAAIMAAMTLGCDHLTARDGAVIAFPVLKPPVRCLLGFDSYKLGGASVMHTLRGLLGIQGETFNEDLAGGASGCPSLIRVKHARARTEADWSLIYVFPYDGVRPRSMELDLWWLDEPPPVLYLEAVRSRIGAHRALRGLITATPLERKVWHPIKAQYPASEGEVEGGRARVRWSVFDNEALPQAVKDELERRAHGSAYEKAKLYGHHVDASGVCPWATELLDEWEAKTLRGRLLKVTVTDEQDRPDGRHKYEISRVVETWAEKSADGVYLVTLDASSGTKSADHDPAGAHVWDMKSRTLVARFGQIEGLADQWNGYVGPYGLGWIGAKLAQMYAVGGLPALVAPEANAWSGPTLTALRDAKHSRIVHDRPVDMPGQEATRLGFVNSERTRPLFIGAVEQALERRDVTIYSPEVIRCLKDCVLDAKGKIVAGPGYHDEDLILAGSALHLIGQRYRAPMLRKPTLQTFRESLKVPQRPPPRGRAAYQPASDKW